MSTLIVHTDANDDLDAFEVVPTIFASLAELTQVVQQSITGLEIANFILLGSVVMDNFGAVGGSDARDVLVKWGATVGDDETLVESRAAEDIEGHEGSIVAVLV